MDDDDESLGSFFICEEYKKKIWKLRTLEVPLFGSNMSSTDHDLTGQIVWPASILGSLFVASHPALFRSKALLELGAGCGLCGFTASHYCDKVLITDGNDVVIRLLLKNKEECAEGRSIYIDKLSWGIISEVTRTIDSFGSPDVIIGADVLLWPDYVLPLLLTIVLFLQRSTDRAGKCYISYVVRATTTTDRLRACADQLGLVLHFIKPEEFLLEDELVQFQTLEVYIIEMKLSDESQNINVNFEELEMELNSKSAPC